MVETLKQKDRLDEEQTRKIEELINLLKAKDLLDTEQTEKILALEEKIVTINEHLEELLKKLNNRTIALFIISLIAIVIAVVSVIGV